jgi:hypothetical protein
MEENHKTCAICTDIISDDMVLLKCAHIHHKGCLTEWIEINNTCPICRETVSSLVDL